MQHLTEGNYDLYYFDQAGDAEGNEWINMHEGGTLQAGKGYLYANSTNVTLTFTGTPYSGNGEVTLEYSDANPSEAMRGWNLVGNPFATAATIDCDGYVMNGDGTEILTTSSRSINPMQGVFVKATAVGQQVTFTPDGTDTGSKLVLNLVSNERSASLIDRAIIRFDEGGNLPKFMFDGTNTRIYITQEGTDYAVVSRNDQNTMPLSFKAKENGTYMIKIEASNLDMEYLHLIDNLTNTDVDLLATPSYTFEATTHDLAERFNLVFLTTTGVDEAQEHFAFYNGHSWTVSNQGEATLQVIDVTGRLVSTNTIDGTAQFDVNAAPGIYMFRLINGNDVKVQKVVVR